jgi:hypothetical protein
MVLEKPGKRTHTVSLPLAVSVTHHSSSPSNHLCFVCVYTVCVRSVYIAMRALTFLFARFAFVVVG